MKELQAARGPARASSTSPQGVGSRLEHNWPHVGTEKVTDRRQGRFPGAGEPVGSGQGLERHTGQRAPDMQLQTG